MPDRVVGYNTLGVPTYRPVWPAAQPWPAPQPAMQWYSCARPAAPAGFVDRARVPEAHSEPAPLAELGADVLDHAKSALEKIRRM